jgi:integrase
LAPLEPRALTPGQVRTLKNMLDRRPRFHQHKGRRRSAAVELHGHARPLRDRAIVHTLLGSGLRREELVNLDLDQVTPNTPEALRTAKKAKISGVRGKGGTNRTVFLGADGRTALADYLEHERPTDAGPARGPRCSRPPPRSARAARRPALPALGELRLRVDAVDRSDGVLLDGELWVPVHGMRLRRDGTMAGPVRLLVRDSRLSAPPAS